jgi:cell wall-associated NlpC family hydrolase
MAVARAQVVAAARKYLGRPVRHQGRGVGTNGAFDCVGIVLAVAEDLNLVDIHAMPIRRSDYANYGSQPASGFVQQECAARLCIASDGGIGTAAKRAILKPGDVITLRVPTIPCHAAIVGDFGTAFTMIHAYSSARKVAENIMDDAWVARIAGIFSFPGVTD